MSINDITDEQFQSLIKRLAMAGFLRANVTLNPTECKYLADLMEQSLQHKNQDRTVQPALDKDP